VKRRKQALAWVLSDCDPGALDWVMSFPGICETFDLGVDRMRRSAVRQAVAAELARRQRFLVERGRTRLSLDPAVIEAELVAAAHAINPRPPTTSPARHQTISFQKAARPNTRRGGAAGRRANEPEIVLEMKKGRAA
jgi:hypothetical protein